MKKGEYIKRVEAALVMLSRGEMVIVVDDFNRENEGDLVAIAEKATPATINFMATYGRGLICQPITADQAESLDLAPMVIKSMDTHHTAFTISVDHESSTTGISAFERARTINAVANPNTKPGELRKPGHIFPLIAKQGGVLTRRGHTEAAVDLARLAGFSPSGVICEIMKDNGSMARVPDLELFAQKNDLLIVSVDDLLRYRDAIGDVELTFHSESSLPSKYGDFRIFIYTSEDPAVQDIVVLESDSRLYNEHSISTKSNVPLVRIHSECSTGEVFGSIRCDCGPQLHAALTRIGQEGGAFVYLKQEGRGIGLKEKIRAYALQDEGADTVEANILLGHAADARRFGAAAAVLRKRGYNEIRLLTNNPQKEQAIQNAGMKIMKRERIVEGVCDENIKYLQTKVQKFGHILEGIQI